MLESFIENNKLQNVTGNIFELNKNAGQYCRVLHNTKKDGLPIFLKYFNEGNNVIISIGDNEKNSFYISETDSDGNINETFIKSIKNFRDKPASLKIEAVEV